MAGHVDGTARVWELPTGQLVGEIDLKDSDDRDAESDFARRLPTLGPTGRQLAVAIDDDVRLWTIDDVSSPRTLPGDHARVSSLQFDSTGARILVAGSEGTVSIWGTADGELLHQINSGSILLQARWSPDDSLVGTLPLTGATRLWTLTGRNGRLANRLGSHRHITPWIEFFPDSQRLLTSSGQGSIRIWNSLAGSHQTIAADTTRPIHRVVASGDSAHLAISLGLKSVVVVDRQTNAPVLDLSAPSLPATSTRRAVISTDGKLLASTLDPFTPLVMDVDSRQVLASYGGHNTRVAAICFTADETQIVTASWDGSLHVWDARTGAPVAQTSHGAEITALASRSDGSIAAGDAVGNILIYGHDLNQLKHRLVEQKSRVTTLQWSPDGGGMAVGFQDGSCSWWTEMSSSNAPLCRQLGAHLGRVNATAFLDDQRLLTAAQTGTKVWDLETGLEILSIDEGANDITRLNQAGDLFSCNRGLLFHWDVVGSVVQQGRRGGSVQQQQAGFDQIRRQRLSRPATRLPVESSEQQLVTVNRSVAEQSLRLLIETIQQRSSTDDPADGSAEFTVADEMTALGARDLGLQVGDRLTRIAGRPVVDSQSAIDAIGAAATALETEADELVIEWIRGGVPRQVRIMLVDFEESTLQVTLERGTAIDLLTRLNDGYRQLKVDDASQQEAVVLRDEYNSADRRRYLAARLSPADQIVGFNGRAIGNFDQLLNALESFLPQAQSNDVSEFSFTVRRGASRLLQIRYSLE